MLTFNAVTQCRTVTDLFVIFCIHACTLNINFMSLPYIEHATGLMVSGC